jgi:hypothetical protein
MSVFDFISDPEWHTQEKLSAFFDWATSAPIEESGEARRQLGYDDGYLGERLASPNSDYMKGYRQGVEMRRVQDSLEA